MKRYLAYAVCVFVMAGQSLGADEAPEPSGRRAEAIHAGIAVSVTFPEQSLAGQAIPLVIRIKNQSQKTVDYFDTFKYKDFQIEVLDSEGNAVPLTRFGTNLAKSDIVWRCVSRKLKPGEEVKDTLNLSRLFDLSLSGDYVLTLSRDFEGTPWIPARKRTTAELEPRLAVSISKFAFKVIDAQ